MEYTIDFIVSVGEVHFTCWTEEIETGRKNPALIDDYAAEPERRKSKGGGLFQKGRIRDDVAKNKYTWLLNNVPVASNLPANLFVQVNRVKGNNDPTWQFEVIVRQNSQIYNDSVKGDNIPPQGRTYPPIKLEK